MTFAAITGQAAIQMPYTSHNATPRLNSVNISSEMSCVERVRQAWITCGTKAIVVSVPAARPSVLMSSIESFSGEKEPHCWRASGICQRCCVRDVKRSRHGGDREITYRIDVGGRRIEHAIDFARHAVGRAARREVDHRRQRIRCLVGLMHERHARLEARGTIER